MRTVSIREFWNRLTLPGDPDPEKAIHEYMARVVLLVLSLVVTPFTVFVAGGWIAGFIPADTLAGMLIMTALFIGGQLMASRGLWRISGFIPPALLFAAAVFGNYIGGIDAPAMLLYALTIVLAALLLGRAWFFTVMVLCIGSYLLLALLHYQGVIIQMRSGRTAFENRVIIACAALLSISLLIQFLINRFRTTLAEEVRRSREISSLAENNAALYEQASREITERRAAETELRKSEERFRALADNSPDVIMRFDAQCRHIYVNPAVESYTGMLPGEFIGKTHLEIGFPEGLCLTWESAIGQVFRTREVNRIEFMLPNGTWFDWILAPEFDNDGTVSAALASARNITERKAYEREISHSLEEKEVLLKEIHHRVKNNFQIIVSLLSLQAGHTHNIETLNNLDDARSRISAMALIHEKLYQTDDLSRIEFGEYLRVMSAEVYASHCPDPERIALGIDVEKIFLPVNKAIPCGLAVNELLINAFKHAFPGDRKGAIRLVMKKSDNSVTIEISDDGTGIPGEIDPRNSKSLGLTIINMLIVTQLRGELVFHGGRGTSVVITLPS